MAAPSDALRKLQDYFQKLKGAEKSSPSPEDRSAYASQLEIAFGELTHQVKEEQKTLEQVPNTVLMLSQSQTNSCLVTSKQSEVRPR